MVGLYLSMVLIGSRHWSGGRDGTSLLGHYLVRTLRLIAIALGVNFVFTNSDALSNARERFDGRQSQFAVARTRRSCSAN